MTPLVQQIIVGAFILGAVAYLAWRFLRKRKAGDKSCGDCCGSRKK
jgi:hypothetical protein